MNKFYGIVGFVISTDKGGSVWIDEPVERYYYGNVIKNKRQWESSQGVNENIALNNQLSILSDDFLCENMGNIRYVKMGGANWRVTSAEELYPRIMLTLGGVYNGPTVS